MQSDQQAGVGFDHQPGHARESPVLCVRAEHGNDLCVLDRAGVRWRAQAITHHAVVEHGPALGRIVGPRAGLPDRQTGAIVGAFAEGGDIDEVAVAVDACRWWLHELAAADQEVHGFEAECDIDVARADPPLEAARIGGVAPRLVKQQQQAACRNRMAIGAQTEMFR